MYLKMRFCSSLLAFASVFALVQAPLSSQAAGEKKLEVFSWWTSGGEAAALDALFNTYKKQNPGVEIINATVAGGGGSACFEHGEAAPAAFQQALNDAVTAFIVDKNIDNFANALVQGAKESEATK